MSFAQEPKFRSDLLNEYVDAVGAVFGFSGRDESSIPPDDDHERLLRHLEETTREYASEVIFEAIGKRDPRLRLQRDETLCEELIDRFVENIMDLRRVNDPSLPGWRDETLNDPNPVHYLKERQEIISLFESTIQTVGDKLQLTSNGKQL